jgi:S1-C subfamily serine protease
MEERSMLEAVERYIAGEMSPDERVYFESLRKSSPEIDQAVVEHTYFLQQMARFEDTRQFKAILDDTHIHLAEKGQIESPKLRGGAKVLYLFNRYKRTVAVAASIAGITMLCASALVWSISPNKNAISKDVEQLSKEVSVLKRKTNQHANEINKVKAEIDAVYDEPSGSITYSAGGTGFLVDVKGYLVTNAHVVENVKYVAVQNAKGQEFRAKIVFTDSKRDLAILKVVDTSFKSPANIPYTIKNGSTAIAESIFSLGFPRNDDDIVYGEGYLAAKTGYNGDTLAVQISINANRGNSGSPIINRKGEIIGVLNAKQTSAEGAVFAVQSKYIYEALNQLQKSDTAYRNLKFPASSSIKGIERTKQVEKISDYIYMVKVNQ